MEWPCIGEIVRAASAGEAGVAGIGMAFLLSSTVVTGAVVAGAVLDVNADASEAVERTVNEAIAGVTGGVEPRGGVVVEDVDGDGTLTGGDIVTFAVGPRPGSGEVVLEGEGRGVVVSYGDDAVRATGVAYTVTWVLGDGPGLGWGEMAELSVVLPVGAMARANDAFRVEVALGTGGVTVVERRLPAVVGSVMYLP